MAQDRPPHARRPATFEVQIEQIELGNDFEPDDKIIQEYQKLAQGKLQVALTRWPSDDIQLGFSRREADGSIRHVSNAKATSAALIEAEIRAGHRPTIDLFWNPHCRPDGGFICPDDENSLLAYRNIGIKLVPCRIIRPKKIEHSEAILWLKKGQTAIAIAKTLSPQVESWASYFGVNEVPIAESAPKLISLCADVRRRISAFHAEAGMGLHYHQMLFAFVRRHELAIETIADLVIKGRSEHALVIVRMAYESFLNFYLDWLAPETIGPRLQLLGLLREAEARNTIGLDDAWKSLENFAGLFENAADKARLSPLGLRFHAAVYPPLSLVAHQSYANIEKHASGFDDCVQELSETDERQLSRWLDLLTAAILTRAENEIGL